MADVAPLSSADIEVARVRARRRLVGMVVLVGVGVVALPWLFETQPRPMGPDVQVVSAASPRGNGPVTSSRSAPPAIASVTVPVPEAPAESTDEPAEQAPASKPAPAPASAPAVSASKPAPVRAQASQAVTAKPAPAPAAKEAAKKEPAKPAAAADNVAAKEKEAARAKSLLEDKPPATKPAAAPEPKTAAKPAPDPAGTRYVVQIGAFSDVPTAREVRLKAERAGVKTYTQEVTVNGGKKIRVRVGPYASKAEADKAVDTLRKAGMTSALLTL